MSAAPLAAAPEPSSARAAWLADVAEAKRLGVGVEDLPEIRETQTRYAGRADLPDLVASHVELVKARRTRTAAWQQQDPDLTRQLAERERLSEAATQAVRDADLRSPPVPVAAAPAKSSGPWTLLADARARVEAALGDVRPAHGPLLCQGAAERAVTSLAVLARSVADRDLLALVAERTGLPARELGAILAERRKAAKRPRRGPPVPAPAPAAARPARVLPTIRVRPELDDVVRESEDALLAASVGVYQRGGALVHVVRDAAGARIVPLPKAALNVLLAQHAVWVCPKRVPNGESFDVRVLPPRAVLDGLYERGTWRLPELEALVATPVLRPDGSVLDAPGYDAATRLIYEPAIAFPAVPEHPTRDAALYALHALAEPFEDFPFVDERDRAAALALLLTVLGRSAFSGAAPLFLVRATVAGTGKQLLANVVSCVATGADEPPSFAAPREDAEWTKTIASHVRDAARFVLVDEARDLRSPALVSLITRERMCERLLGTNGLVRGQLPVFVACGNNTLISDDMGRRVVPIRLDAGVERPERRDGFRHPRLLAWVAEQRPDLVAAALTVLRAFVAAGRPASGLAPLGSFEGWCALVRDALVWLEVPDPVGAQDAIREEADVGADDTLALLRAWREALGEAAYSAREIVDRAASLPELRELLLSLDPKERDTLNSRRLGYALRRLKGKPVDGLKLVSEGRGGHERGVSWRVVAAAPDDPRHRPHLPPIVRSIVRTYPLETTSTPSPRNDADDRFDPEGNVETGNILPPDPMLRTHAPVPGGSDLSSASSAFEESTIGDKDLGADDAMRTMPGSEGIVRIFDGSQRSKPPLAIDSLPPHSELSLLVAHSVTRKPADQPPTGLVFDPDAGDAREPDP